MTLEHRIWTKRDVDYRKFDLQRMSVQVISGNRKLKEIPQQLLRTQLISDNENRFTSYIFIIQKYIKDSVKNIKMKFEMNS